MVIIPLHIISLEIVVKGIAVISLHIITLKEEEEALLMGMGSGSGIISLEIVATTGLTMFITLETISSTSLCPKSGAVRPSNPFTASRPRLIVAKRFFLMCTACYTRTYTNKQAALFLGVVSLMSVVAKMMA